MEKSCGKNPTNISQQYDDMSDTEVIHLTCKTSENHQSIKGTRKNLTESAQFKTCEEAFKKHRPEKIYRHR